MSICYASLVIGFTYCTETITPTQTDNRLQTQHPVVLIWEDPKVKVDPKFNEEEVATSQEGEPTKPATLNLNSEHPSKLLIQNMK